MTKLEVCIKRLAEDIEAAEGAYFIRPIRLERAKEILRQLEAKGGTVNHSEGTQPNPTAAGVQHS